MKNDFESGSDARPDLPKVKATVLTNTPARKSLHGRRSSIKKTQLRELNNGKVVFISLLFAMVFSPFNGIQNFLFEIMREYKYNYLGLVALGVFYISFGYGSLYTPQYSTRVDYKFAFFLSFFPMGLFFLSLQHSMSCVGNEDSSLCGSFFIYLIVFVCSVLAGIGTSLLWISKTIYVTDSSNPYNKGKMFGTFTSIAQWTQMIGIAFTGLILYDFYAKTLFLVAMIVCFLASALALVISPPDKHGGDAQMMYELGNLGGQESMTLEGTERLLPKSDIIIPRMEYFTKSFFVRCLSAQKMQIFYPLFIASACNVSVFVTYLAGDVLAVLQENVDVETAFSAVALKVTAVFLALGLGEVLAHKFFSVKVNTDKRAALSTLYKTFLLSAALHLILGRVKMYSLYIPLAFLYGVGDNGSQEVIGGLISMKFVERFEPFTCFRIVFFTALGIFLLMNVLFVSSAPAISFVLFIISTIAAWLNNYKFFTTLT